MTVKELKNFINEMEDNLSNVDKISFSNDCDNEKIFVISSEFGFYENFSST